MKICFLGGGNMASALIGGLCRAGYREQIFVAERSADNRSRLAERYAVRTGDRLPELSEQDILVLAVKPQDMQAACRGLKHNRALVLSVAAGLSTATLSTWLDGTQRIIRVMPNTPATLGLGVSGLFAASGADAADCARAEQIMATAGSTLWLDDEEQMHAVTAVSGSGPAYVFYLMNALQQAAESLGFPPEQSHQLSLQTFKGAVALAEQSESGFHTLQQQVTSKGGTTAAALAVFEQQHLDECIRQAVQAAADRSAEMARQTA